MRRLMVSILIIIALVALAAGVWADKRTIAAQPEDPLIIIEPPGDWLDAQAIQVTDLTPSIRRPDAGPAADQCGSATPLNLSFANTGDGGATVTNNFTQEAGDPIFGCLFGGPLSLQGFRTAWYELTAGDTSIVTITTEGTEYDTVLGVYSGSCDTLTTLACSDDFRGLQSSVSLRVVRGRTYYIVVADYNPGVPDVATLKFSAVMHDGGANWVHIGNMPFGGVSRHAFASNGPDMYIIGGQTHVPQNEGQVPVITRKLFRYNAVEDEWVILDDMPGSSLSNTTAVYLNGKIYIPGGFNGNTSDYGNFHLVYDIATNAWDQNSFADIPTGLLPNGEMFAWSSAVAGPGATSYYLTGGLTSYPAIDENGVVINNVYRFTPSTNQWEAVQPMMSPRYAHTAAWVFAANRGLCVAGGLSSGEDQQGAPVIVLLTGGECFNPAAGSWQPTGNLNFPRYNAGSAVGPDGNWYIFGGLDANGGVPETEVYDPNTNTWHVLGGEFSLGGMPQNPARSWPRGAFWNNTLYVFGGNTPPPENGVISSADQLTFGVGSVPLANIVLLPLSTTVESNNFLANGTPLPLNVPVSGNFVETTHFFNAYYFDWPVLGKAIIQLIDVPADSNFNIYVYDKFKTLLVKEDSPLTGPKTVSLTVKPDRYYVMIERVSPKDPPDPNDVYQLTLLNN